jgi:hypothetical protein
MRIISLNPSGMIYFFSADNQIFYAIDALYAPDDATTGKLHWLMQGAALLPYSRVEGYFNGPRKEMITPGAQMPSRSRKTWVFRGYGA